MQIYEENSASVNEFCWQQCLQTRATKINLKYVMHLGQHIQAYPSSGQGLHSQIVSTCSQTHPTCTSGSLQCWCFRWPYQTFPSHFLPSFPLMTMGWWFHFLLMEVDLSQQFTEGSPGSQHASLNQHSQLVLLLSMETRRDNIQLQYLWFNTFAVQIKIYASTKWIGWIWCGVSAKIQRMVHDFKRCQSFVISLRYFWLHRSCVFSSKRGD